MRTTLTLDSDLMLQLRAEAKRTGESFKQVVNRIIRLGLAKPPKPPKPKFKVQPRSLGEYPGLNYDRISELIEYGEGPFHR